MRYALYSAAGSARSAARGSEVGTLTTALRAVSEEEAEGIALRLARENYPEKDGWRHHSAHVVEVPMDWIREAATTRQSGSEE